MASLTPSQHTHTDDPAYETPTVVAQDLAQSREAGLAQAPERTFSTMSRQLRLRMIRRTWGASLRKVWMTGWVL
jgi:hypothetical protein